MSDHVAPLGSRCYPGSTIPGVVTPHVVHPQVREVLDAGHRMTVLRAPVGFGKTTAVTSWLAAARAGGVQPASARRTVVWHGLSAPPVSSATFWDAVAADLAAITSAAAPGSPATYDDVRDLVSALTAPLLLVIDDLEAESSTPISERSPVGEITTELVDLLDVSPHLDVLITCRPYGPLAMDAIFGPGAQILDSAELTLDAADTLDLADAAGVHLTLEQAHHLQVKLWGWPALTSAVITRLAASGADYDEASWEIAGDFLAGLDSERTDPEVAHFIRQVCILDPLTGPLADRLTGSPYATRTLADLERAGLARSHLHDGERHYTLLPAVVRSIRTRPAAAAEHGPAHRHAAKMLRTLPEQALRHALLAQDWELAMSIAEAATVPLILDHPQELSRALAQIPVSRLADHPGLFQLAAALRRFDNDLTTPLPSWDAPLDPSALRRALTVATAQIIALRACHQDVAACELVERCSQALLSTDNLRTASGTAVPLFLLHTGIARCLVGEVRPAIDTFERCFELSCAAGLDSVTRAAAEYSALVRAITGDTSGAREALTRAQRFSHALVAVQFVDVQLDQLVRALIALDQLDLLTARMHLPPADQSYRNGVPPAWFVDAHVRAHLGLLSGDLFSATTGLGRVLRDRRTSLQRGTLSSRMLTATAATINVWGGNTTRAKNFLESIPRGTLVDAVHADVALQMGDVQGALDITNASLAADSVPVRLRIEALITRCVARARQDDRAGAEADLRLAIEIADPLLLRPFLAVPRDLLADFADQAPEVSRLQARLEATGINLTPVEHHAVVNLTAAEQDLLRALDTGASVDALATARGTTVAQTLTALSDLFKSLGVHDRLGALAAGHMLGYLGVPGT